MFKKLIYVLFGLLLLLNFSCESSSDSSAVPDQPLFDSVWSLDEIDRASGDDVDLDEDLNEYTIVISDDGTVAVVSDCNTCSAVATINTDTGSFVFEDDVVCTDADCGPDSVDDTFKAALKLVNRYEINGEYLYLFYGNQESRLEFETDYDED